MGGRADIQDFVVYNLNFMSYRNFVSEKANDFFSTAELWPK